MDYYPLANIHIVCVLLLQCEGMPGKKKNSVAGTPLKYANIVTECFSEYKVTPK